MHNNLWYIMSDVRQDEIVYIQLSFEITLIGLMSVI